MAWTTPTTVNPGDAILASLWNTQVKDNLLELAPFAAEWTNWTPTLVGSGFTITQGNSAKSGKYLKVGKFVTFWGKWVFGSTTSFGAGSGSFDMSLPFTAKNADTLAGLQIVVLDSGTAHYPFLNLAVDNSTTVLRATPMSASASYVIQSSVNATVPFTWAVNDAVWWAGTYETA